MKVTLDLTDLVARGKLTAGEAERLKALSAEDTSALGANILLGFGTVAVALGVGVFLPTAMTAIVVGALFFALGLTLSLLGNARWLVFAQLCLVVGALAAAGGLVVQFDSSLWVEAALTVGLAVASVLARSALLSALAVVMGVVALGSGTAYFHGLYAFWVPHPALVIGSLAVLTLALYLVSLRVPPAYERLALTAARTAILIINAAFLVGSLFGDDDLHWSDLVFVIGWAVVLLAVGAWAVRANRRWVVNIAAVFLAIHFYTQWFERLGPSPLSILGGGVVLIIFGVLLRMLNQRKATPAVAAPAV